MIEQLTPAILAITLHNLARFLNPLALTYKKPWRSAMQELINCVTVLNLPFNSICAEETVALAKNLPSNCVTVLNLLLKYFHNIVINHVS